MNYNSIDPTSHEEKKRLFMNDKFLELPEEKKLRIINAGFDVFGNNEYKRASTEEIAFQAGISKGLLFYYFKNKKSFYLYLFDYCYDVLATLMEDPRFETIDDFFELMRFGAEMKLSLLQKHPHIVDFVMKSWFSENETISEDIKKRSMQITNTTFRSFFHSIDLSRFKEGIDPVKIFKMMGWMADGYMREVLNKDTALDLESLLKEFYEWEVIFKQMAYKEEFQCMS